MISEIKQTREMGFELGIEEFINEDLGCRQDPAKE